MYRFKLTRTIVYLCKSLIKVNNNIINTSFNKPKDILLVYRLSQI
jgi:hypothetical protein